MDLLKLSATYKSYHITETGEYEVIFSFPRQLKTALITGLDRIKECQKPIVLTVKKETKKRSLDANAYGWVLIDKLAEVLNKSKTEVYREAIRDIGGNSTLVCVQDKAVETLRTSWEHNGLGWVTETFPSKLKGCTNVQLFYGSSVYDTKQMSLLIDHLKQECEAQGIDTMPPEELKRLLEGWGK